MLKADIFQKLIIRQLGQIPELFFFAHLTIVVKSSKITVKSLTKNGTIPP